MEALKHVRMITPQLDSSIGVNGVRESDEFIIEAFQERKKSFKLNRTKYIFENSDKFHFDYTKAFITLPFFGKESGRFELELITSAQTKHHNHKSRYIFRSLGDEPFRINGIHCFEAFLERGDIVDVGFNRIHFPRASFAQNTQVKSNILSSKIIQSPISVMIEGETGTGKTTLAKQIHEESGRMGRFVHLNLSAFSAGLIESELFGHVKGAFTGAMNAKRGAILEAHKGTLFLDEIDSLSLDLQTKLLLFLDNYEVRAVGGEQSTKADVRMIFASGSKLSKKVEDSLMRQDFYFRLQAGCSLSLESLRQRPERIVELCRTFEANEAVVIDNELLNFYSSCQWPGNIRQLQSHLKKKKILSDGKKMVLDQQDFELNNLNLALKKSDMENIVSLEVLKINYCYDVYLKMEKNLTRTAKILQLCQNTLKAYLAKKEESLRDHKVIHVNF